MVDVCMFFSHATQKVTLGQVQMKTCSQFFHFLTVQQPTVIRYLVALMHKKKTSIQAYTHSRNFVLFDFQHQSMAINCNFKIFFREWVAEISHQDETDLKNFDIQVKLLGTRYLIYNVKKPFQYIWNQEYLLK